jgi:hypothetical protein
VKPAVLIGVPIFLAFMATTLLAKNIDQSKTAGPYRVELEVLPPEPFYSAKQVAAGEGKTGMLILGGAEPVQPDAPSHPDHHLVVHVFQKTTNKALTNAKVRLAVQPLDSKGQPTGKAMKVPVVRMQMISMAGMGGMGGMGSMGAPQTTHYGNNVTLPPGDYRVEAIANGYPVSFVINISKE